MLTSLLDYTRVLNLQRPKHELPFILRMETVDEDLRTDPYLLIMLTIRLSVALSLGGLMLALYVPVGTLRKWFPNVNNGQENHLVVEGVSLLQEFSLRIMDLWKFLVGLFRNDDQDGQSLDKYVVIYWVVFTQLLWSFVQVAFYSRFNSVLSALEAKDKALLYQEVAIQSLIAILQQAAWGIQHVAIHRAEAMFNVHVSTKLVRAYLKRKLFYGNGDDTRNQLVILNDMQLFTGSLFNALTTILFPLLRLVLIYSFTASITPKLQSFLSLFALYVTGIVVFSWWDYDSLNRSVTTAKARLGKALNGIEEGAEALLFYHGEFVEEIRVKQLARQVASAVYTLRATTFKNGLFTWVNEELIQLLPFILFSGDYFAGKIDLGGLLFIQHASFYTFYVTNGIPGNIQTLKAVYTSGNNVKRIIQGSIPKPLKVERREPPPYKEPVVVVHDLRVKFRNPLKGVSFQVNRGDKVLIEGGNGAGKTTIFRALAGLLETQTAQGKLQSLSRSRCVFVPQSPYNVPGATLREQILFPRWNALKKGRPTDDQIQQALHKLQIWDRLRKPPKKEKRGEARENDAAQDADFDKRVNRFLERSYCSPLTASTRLLTSLTSLVDTWFLEGLWNTQRRRKGMKQKKNNRRSEESKNNNDKSSVSKALDQVVDLSTLSGGERQLLGLARALLILESLRQEYGDNNGAAIAVLHLDEATSQLHPRTEEAVYTLLVKECETIISIGHRKALRKFHDYKYQIDEGLAVKHEP